jgi:hypothetical protein
MRKENKYIVSSLSTTWKLCGGDFNIKLRREDNFKPRIGNKSFHEINYGNGVWVVNLPHPKSNRQE